MAGDLLEHDAEVGAANGGLVCPVHADPPVIERHGATRSWGSLGCVGIDDPEGCVAGPDLWGRFVWKAGKLTPGAEEVNRVDALSSWPCRAVSSWSPRL